MPLSIPVALR